MPLPEIPWWANALAGVLSGSVITKAIDAFREGSRARARETFVLSRERMSLHEFEERLRASVLHENDSLRARLLDLEKKVEDFERREQECKKHNEELEDEIQALRDANAALKRDFDEFAKTVAREHFGMPRVVPRGKA